MMTVTEKWSEMMSRDPRVISLAEEFGTGKNWQHLDLHCAERYRHIAEPMWEAANKNLRDKAETNDGR